MLKKDGQFYHYEPPYMPGEILIFPNGGPNVAIEALGTGKKLVSWNGRSGDTVVAAPGTQFRPLGGPVDYVYTLREDGWLDARLSPSN